MKACKRCDCLIPDHAAHCPHCRHRQPRGDRLPQVFLVGVSLAAAAAILFQSCPGLGG
ncbi:MAG: hypothetical protein ACE5HF_04115 [Gemmatimonadota bacterium]